MEKYWSSETISLEQSKVRGPVNEVAGSGLEDFAAQICHKILRTYYNKFHTSSKRDSHSNAASGEGKILHRLFALEAGLGPLGAINTPHAGHGLGR